MSAQHLIVIGGGASGVFCAVNAARCTPGLTVTVLEKTHRLLSKVMVSGGGRCNVTHQVEQLDEMSLCYPRGRHFVRKSFHQFFVKDTLAWFSSRGVDIVPEADGRMFPTTNRSDSIIQCLLAEADKYQVQFRLRSEVVSISKRDHQFDVTLMDGQLLHGDYVFIGSGGYASESSFDWIRASGHEIIAPLPSLFTFKLPDHPLTSLMGVSVGFVTLKIQGTSLKEQGPLLITHWGLSGPAVLRASAWGARELGERGYSFQVIINWCGELSRAAIIDIFQDLRSQKGAHPVHARALFGLPSRLWQFLVESAGIGSQTRWADLPSARQSAFVELLTAHRLDVNGKTTFKEEFVTSGGVATREVDPSTMQSKRVDGLYFGGEVLDVDGITGGYNFQHAWTSGWIAARHISIRSTSAEAAG